jgi:hypothetical protein
LIKATDFAAAISRTEPARFYPSQLRNSESRESSSSIELGFPPALDGSGYRAYLRLVYRGFDVAEVAKCVSSYYRRSQWSSLHGRFHRALAVADEIGEGPQSARAFIGGCDVIFDRLSRMETHPSLRG